jgi:hypothetical protein
VNAYELVKGRRKLIEVSLEDLEATLMIMIQRTLDQDDLADRQVLVQAVLAVRECEGLRLEVFNTKTLLREAEGRFVRIAKRLCGS